jgi:DNA repair protein RadD
MASRDYQSFAINRSFDWLANSTSLGGVVAMPTGTGKSHVIAGVAQKAFEIKPNARIQMLVHVKELIKQNLDKLQEAWPQAPVGIYSAGLNQKQFNMPITYGGIASMHKIPEQFGHVDLCLVDEGHLLNPNSDTMYFDYLDALRKVNPYLRVIALTATPWRTGQGKITDGAVFSDTIVDMTGVEPFNWFFEQGYLVKPIPRPTETTLDMSGVGISNGDYKPGEMQKAVDQYDITVRALREACHYGQNRYSWMVFAAGVEHADHVCEILNAMGIPTTVVHRGIEGKERTRRIEAYKRGEYRCIVGNNILTTGFDHPALDMIIVLRPTMSSSLWVQMLGRGTRPLWATGGFFDLNTSEGRLASIANSRKQNCLVLDFAANTAQLGPINDPVIPKAKGMGGGDAPVKICETERLKPGYKGCGAYNHTLVKHCDNCGAEFDFSVKFSAMASVRELVANGVDDFQWFDVQNTFYSKQIGASGLPYLRVDYYVTPKKRYSDYIHLEQKGWLLHQAKEWWYARTKRPDWGVPDKVDGALKAELGKLLKEPKRIRVWVNKEPIPEVTNYEYE